MVEEETNLVFVLIGEVYFNSVSFKFSNCIFLSSRLYIFEYVNPQMKLKALLLLERLLCLVLSLQIPFGYRTYTHPKLYHGFILEHAEKDIIG